MKQRWLLSILSILALLYFALPRLPLAKGLPQYFSVLWLCFALTAIGGNLAAFMYTNAKKKTIHSIDEINRERQRNYDS